MANFIQVSDLQIIVHSSDVDQIEAGIGDKMALFFQYFCSFIAGFIVGFYKGWKLTLVLLAVTPLLAIAGAAVGKVSFHDFFSYRWNKSDIHVHGF